jgi:hypothetical protein
VNTLDTLKKARSLYEITGNVTDINTILVPRALIQAQIKELESAKPVTFGMRGEKMTFSIGNQSFTLDYEPTEDGELEFMGNCLLEAFSHLAKLAKYESAEPVSLQAAHDQVTIDCLNDKVMYLMAKLEKYESAKPVGALWQHDETGRSVVLLPGDRAISARWFEVGALYLHPKEKI